MVTKVKRLPVVHPFDRVAEWSVVNRGVALVINREVPLGLREEISLDIEHDGTGKFVGLGIYTPQSNTCYYWSEIALIRICEPLPRFIAHNGVSDLDYLNQWGFKLGRQFLSYDTYLMEHIIDSSQHDYSLTTLTKKRLEHYYPGYKEICGKTKTFADFPPEMIAEKNACDTYYCYQLMKDQKCRLY